MSFREHRFWFSVVLLALGYLIGEAWMGASMALLQVINPSSTPLLTQLFILLFTLWHCYRVCRLRGDKG